MSAVFSPFTLQIADVFATTCSRRGILQTRSWEERRKRGPYLRISSCLLVVHSG